MSATLEQLEWRLRIALDQDQDAYVGSEIEEDRWYAGLRLQSISFDDTHATCVFLTANGENVGWRWCIRSEAGWSALDDLRMAGILFTTHLMEDCWEADLGPPDQNGVRWLVHHTLC